MRTLFASFPRAIAASALLLCLPLGGCFLEDSKAIRKTQDFYHTHINKPVEVDLQKTTQLGEADSRLVSRLIPVDTQLTALERRLNSVAGDVNLQMMERILYDFPWLSSVVALSPEGEILAIAPPIPLKNIDYSPLMQAEAHSMPRDLRVSVQDNQFGPEVLIARPFYNAQDLQIILAASFDFSSLMLNVEGADQVIVRTPEIILWNGQGNPLSGVDWNSELKNRSFGNIDGQAWLVRYCQFVPLIFVTPGD